jgi:hypothetical protein
MWFRIINIILGLWLMLAPALLGYAEPARTNSYIVGPLAASFAAVALSEVTRAARWVNVLLGLWLIIAPLALGYGGVAAANSLIVGALLGSFALIPGRRSHRIGGGWPALWSASAGRESDKEVV